MNFLFVHTNFPAQFRHVAGRLAADPRHAVFAIGSPTSRSLPRVSLFQYSLAHGGPAGAHAFARRFDADTRRAEQVLYAAAKIASTGFAPDTIVAHCGWGEHLPLRALFPKARLILYTEYFYNSQGYEIGFDPEAPAIGVDAMVALQAQNAATLIGLVECDAAYAPTQWQKSTYPALFHDKISLLHEGIDVDLFKPDPRAWLDLDSGRRLTAADEVITFVSRNLEPLRGYHQFMRALPAILQARPAARAVIIGGDGVAYGPAAPNGQTWKSIFLDEVKERLDLSRVHFTGHIPVERYRAALQISSAHVYLTYPFVLSWSLLEAMSVGSVVIASDTGPVREVVDGENGILASFFDPEALAAAVVDALERKADFVVMRAKARATISRRYDLARQCLPDMLRFLCGEER